MLETDATDSSVRLLRLRPGVSSIGPEPNHQRRVCCFVLGCRGQQVHLLADATGESVFFYAVISGPARSTDRWYKVSPKTHRAALRASFRFSVDGAGRSACLQHQTPFLSLTTFPGPPNRPVSVTGSHQRGTELPACTACVTLFSAAWARWSDACSMGVGFYR